MCSADREIVPMLGHLVSNSVYTDPPSPRQTGSWLKRLIAFFSSLKH